MIVGAGNTERKDLANEESSGKDGRLETREELMLQHKYKGSLEAEFPLYIHFKKTKQNKKHPNSLLIPSFLLTTVPFPHSH